MPMMPVCEIETTPLRAGALRLRGTVAEQMERFLDRRVRSAEARAVVYREAEDAFRNQRDDASGVHGIWQGEYWGKWILGAAAVCGYYGDAELRAFIGRGARALIALQEPSGYLGTYRDPLNVFAADPAAAERVLGHPCNWNWNIWCRKYTLWGLLEAWRLLGDAEILAAAERLARHLVDSLRDNGIRLGATGTFAGIPSGSILKPMVLLYRATGLGKYLDFAKAVADDWRRPDGLCPNLIANALGGKPVHAWYPEPKTWAKAYEMMSCFEGIVELYRVTGEEALLTAARRFYALLRRHERNMLFSVGYNDIFAHAAGQLNAISEPCDVMHWMRLAYELFLETDEKSYLDDFEMAFYNPFLASTYRDGRWGARGVRSHGRHLTVFEQAEMRHNHCCVTNAPRGFMNMAEAAATAVDGGISVNLYTDFELSAEEMELRVSGDYLRSGAVRLDCRTKRETTLRLRIPAWATTARLTMHGEKREGRGDWFRVALPAGNTGIDLRFGRRVEIREHRAPAERAPAENDDWYRQRWGEPGLEGRFLSGRASTLVYGPLLLARSRFVGNTEKEMSAPALPPGFSCALRPVESEAARCVFAADFGDFATTVCDYASAGNAIVDETFFYSVFF